MVSSINKGELIQEILMNEHKISLHNFSFGGKHYSLNLVVNTDTEFIGYEICIKKKVNEKNDETFIDYSIDLQGAVNCYAKLYRIEFNKYITKIWKATYKKG